MVGAAAQVSHSGAGVTVWLLTYRNKALTLSLRKRSELPLLSINKSSEKVDYSIRSVSLFKPVPYLSSCTTSLFLFHIFKRLLGPVEGSVFASTGGDNYIGLFIAVVDRMEFSPTLSFRDIISFSV